MNYSKMNKNELIERILELCKPQTILRLDFCIALDDIDFLEGRQTEKFLKWWKNYEKDFCEHYSLSHWGIEQMHSVNRFGNLTDCDALIEKLEHANPYKIKL